MNKEWLRGWTWFIFMGYKRERALDILYIYAKGGLLETDFHRGYCDALLEAFNC